MVSPAGVSVYAHINDCRLVWTNVSDVMLNPTYHGTVTSLFKYLSHPVSAWVKAGFYSHILDFTSWFCPRAWGGVGCGCWNLFLTEPLRQNHAEHVRWCYVSPQDWIPHMLIRLGRHCRHQIIFPFLLIIYLEHSSCIPHRDVWTFVLCHHNTDTSSFKIRVV